MNYDKRTREWLAAVGFKNLAEVRAALMSIDDMVQLIDQLLLDEPDYVTHSMSNWNRMRRIRARLVDKQNISPALSYNKKTDTWNL